MSHFYATIQGNSGQATTRQGTKSSGMTSYTASRQGVVKVTLWENEGVDHAYVQLQNWHEAWALPSITLYNGPVSGDGYKEAQRTQVEITTGLKNCIADADEQIQQLQAKIKQYKGKIEDAVRRLEAEGVSVLDVTEAAP